MQINFGLETLERKPTDVNDMQQNHNVFVARRVKELVDSHIPAFACWDKLQYSHLDLRQHSCDLSVLHCDPIPNSNYVY